MTEKVYTKNEGIDKYYAELAALGRLTQAIAKRASADATLSRMERSRVNEVVAQLTADVLDSIEKLGRLCDTRQLLT